MNNLEKLQHWLTDNNFGYCKIENKLYIKKLDDKKS